MFKTAKLRCPIEGEATGVMQWRFVKLGADAEEWVYSNSRVLDPFNDTIFANRAKDGRVGLIIPNTTWENAGEYYCLDRGDNRILQLMVLCKEFCLLRLCPTVFFEKTAYCITFHLEQSPHNIFDSMQEPPPPKSWNFGNSPSDPFSWLIWLFIVWFGAFRFRHFINILVRIFGGCDSTPYGYSQLFWARIEFGDHLIKFHLVHPAVFKIATGLLPTSQVKLNSIIDLTTTSSYEFSYKAFQTSGLKTNLFKACSLMWRLPLMKS